MSTIWKLNLPHPFMDIVHELPAGWRVLAVHEQGGSPHVWVLVDPKAELQKVRFHVKGTGWMMETFGLSYHGTAFTPGGFVWHVFSEIEE